MTLQEEIKRLKTEKNAIILAHYYVADDVQDIADYIGDSYFLCKKANGTNADVIVFCGVRFMGESAAILNPDKKVLMPDPTADCAMVHMIDNADIARMRAQYDDLAVVCYINSSIETKALCDVCVTSSNAVKIVNNLPNKNIFFIPDGNLARYVAEQVPSKNIIPNDGCCPIHRAIAVADVTDAKRRHPEAKFLVHPECVEAVVSEADFVGSTSELIDFATRDACREFIVGTENGVLYELKKRNPDKAFFTVTDRQICDGMKQVTLEKVRDALADERNEMTVNAELAKKALAPLARMLELAK